MICFQNSYRRYFYAFARVNRIAEIINAVTAEFSRDRSHDHNCHCTENNGKLLDTDVFVTYGDQGIGKGQLSQPWTKGNLYQEAELVGSYIQVRETGHARPLPYATVQYS
jgi:hypothetical protein